MSPLRIVYCTYPSIYSSLVLKALLKSKDVDVVGIIHSKRIYKKKGSYFKNVYQLFCITGLRYLLYQFCISDLFSLLSYFSKYKTTQHYINQYQIPFLNTNDINQQRVLTFIKNQNPDLLLCSHFNQLLKKPLINLMPLGAINIHPSFLPYYKGVDPVFYQLLDKQPYLGVTVHQINIEFDQGDIIQQAQFKKVSNSLFNNNFFLFKQGVQLFLLSLQKNSKSQVQKKLTSNHYDSWPDSKRVQQFLTKNSLIKGYLTLFKH